MVEQGRSDPALSFTDFPVKAGSDAHMRLSSISRVHLWSVDSSQRESKKFVPPALCTTTQDQVWDLLSGDRGGINCLTYAASAPRHEEDGDERLDDQSGDDDDEFDDNGLEGHDYSKMIVDYRELRAEMQDKKQRRNITVFNMVYDASIKV